MTDQILHEDSFYKLVAHGPCRNPTTVLSFDYLRGHRDCITPGPFGDPFLPWVVREKLDKVNLISIIPSRNCWYLDPGIDEVLEKVRDFASGGRIVTFGSSMGAYGAINLGKVVKADFALAISPLSTIFDPFMAAINDRRFPKDRALLSPARDFIRQGLVSDLRGMVFFDPAHAKDACHAAHISAMTSCNMVAVPHGGHPCGVLLNRCYPLKRLLAEVGEGEPPLQDVRRVLRDLVPNSQEAIAASPERFIEFQALCDADLSQIRPTSMLNAAMLARTMPDALGTEPPARAKSLRQLVAWAIDPAMNWATDPQKRQTTLHLLGDAAGEAKLTRLVELCAREAPRPHKGPNPRT